MQETKVSVSRYKRQTRIESGRCYPHIVLSHVSRATWGGSVGCGYCGVGLNKLYAINGNNDEIFECLVQGGSFGLAPVVSICNHQKLGLRDDRDGLALKVCAQAKCLINTLAQGFTAN